MTFAARSEKGLLRFDYLYAQHRLSFSLSELHDNMDIL